ncbi:MAG: hypothetical protein JWQ40_2776 [Segetibacter sp.]|nr:hypothetical protein [Segetibacter sp.]
MKKIIFVFFVSFTSLTLHAQLKNTKWKGTLNLENKIDVVFDYRNDTLEVINSQDNSSIETMSYTIENNILTLKKLSGQSDCDQAPGKYKFEINNNTLTIALVLDACDDRAPILDNSKWTKIK